MNDLLFGTMLFVVHLISVTLGLAIFASLFLKSAVKGAILLATAMVSSVFTLLIAFEFSAVLGYAILLMYVCMGILTFFNVKSKRAAQAA